jgi:FixJ family two-component response regulator
MECDPTRRDFSKAVRERLIPLSERENPVPKGVVAGQANKTAAFEHGISPRMIEV